MLRLVQCLIKFEFVDGSDVHVQERCLVMESIVGRLPFQVNLRFVLSTSALLSEATTPVEATHALTCKRRRLKKT